MIQCGVGATIIPPFTQKVSMTTTHYNEKWTPTDETILRLLARKGESIKQLARILGRTMDAIRAKAGEKGISLKPRGSK